MFELFIGVFMIAVVIFLLGGRPSDPDSRSFVPNDRVAPATSSGSYEAGLAGCPDGQCIASRGENLATGDLTPGMVVASGASAGAALLNCCGAIN